MTISIRLQPLVLDLFLSNCRGNLFSTIVLASKRRLRLNGFSKTLARHLQSKKTTLYTILCHESRMGPHQLRLKMPWLLAPLEASMPKSSSRMPRLACTIPTLSFGDVVVTLLLPASTYKKPWMKDLVGQTINSCSGISTQLQHILSACPTPIFLFYGIRYTSPTGGGFGGRPMGRVHFCNCGTYCTTVSLNITAFII